MIGRTFHLGLASRAFGVVLASAVAACGPKPEPAPPAGHKAPAASTLPVPATPEVDNVTGQNAYLYLRRDSTRDYSPNGEAISKLLRAGVTGPKPMTISADREVVRLLKRAIRGRRNFKADAYGTGSFDTPPAPPPPPDGGGGFESIGQVGQALDGDPPEVDLSKMKSDEYYIPSAAKVPVRNQAARMTCAAFSGTGAMEYAILNDDPSQKLVDLSPQRFYWLAKKDCQADGCPYPDGKQKQGSSSYSGFLNSKNGGDLNVPTAADCAYVDRETDSETQVPQDDSCSTGAAQVTEITFAKGAEGLIDVLNQGYAVSVGSRLTANWKKNRGMINFADNQSDSGAHSGGHAYLIVGYRKLSEEDYPGEGGFCFRVKNSWGTNWGVNGYACQTWRWFWDAMRSWSGGNDTKFWVVPTKVKLRADLVTNPPAPNPVEEDRPSASMSPQVTADPTIDGATAAMLEDPKKVSVPDAPMSTVSDWKPIGLLGPGDDYYRAEYSIAGDTLSVRAVVRGQGKRSGVLALTLKDNQFLMQDDEAVGEISADRQTISICSDEYDAICALRMDPAMNKLYVEFLYDEERDYGGKELPAGDWKPFVTGDHAVIERLIASDAGAVGSYIYLRAALDGAPGKNAIRLPLAGNIIQFQGTPVGEVGAGLLCSGEYQKDCGVYFESGDLEIIPNW